MVAITFVRRIVARLREFLVIGGHFAFAAWLPYGARPMELIVIRHGRPERQENALDGADPPLTDVGNRQARAMAEWMKAEHLDSIYVSPMVRARQTCAPLEAAFGFEATVVDGVREFDAGDPSYIPYEELKQDRAAWEKMVDEWETADRSEFVAEVVDALNGIVSNNRGKRVAVVCHGGVINAYAADVMGLDNNKMFFNPNYTSINRFMVASTGERSVVSLGDIGHLRAHPELILG